MMLRGAGLLAVLIMATAHGVRAESLPLWEAGAGLSVLTLPDYRGADEGRSYVLPVPYLVYRGEFLKADRRGVRGELFESDRVELDLSAGASPPVDSTRNQARRGMSDLRPSVELGPSMEIALWRNARDTTRLDLRLPARAGVTLESSPRFVGWNFSPRLNLDIDSVGGSGWNLGVLAGPIYADRRAHAYFYSVQPEFALADRPAYEARGGYGGMQTLVAVSRRFPRAWVGGFARWDSLSGAVFADSPLVRRQHYFAAGLAVSWIFGESAQRVEAKE